MTKNNKAVTKRGNKLKETQKEAILKTKRTNVLPGPTSPANTQMPGTTASGAVTGTMWSTSGTTAPKNTLVPSSKDSENKQKDRLSLPAPEPLTTAQWTLDTAKQRDRTAKPLDAATKQMILSPTSKQTAQKAAAGPHTDSDTVRSTDDWRDMIHLWTQDGMTDLAPAEQDIFFQVFRETLGQDDAKMSHGSAQDTDTGKPAALMSKAAQAERIKTATGTSKAAQAERIKTATGTSKAAQAERIKTATKMPKAAQAERIKTAVPGTPYTSGGPGIIVGDRAALGRQRTGSGTTAAVGIKQSAGTKQAAWIKYASKLSTPLSDYAVKPAYFTAQLAEYAKGAWGRCMDRMSQLPAGIRDVCQDSVSLLTGRMDFWDYAQKHGENLMPILMSVMECLPYLEALVLTDYTEDPFGQPLPSSHDTVVHNHALDEQNVKKGAMGPGIFVNGQGRGPYKDYVFGTHGNFADNGCMAIAAYNVNVLMGEYESLGDIAERIRVGRYAVIDGFAGNPVFLTHYFESRGCEVEMMFTPTREEAEFEIRAGGADAYVMMFLWRDQQNDQSMLGGHYVMIDHDRDTFRVYNMESDDPVEQTPYDLSDLYAESNFPLILYSIRR